MLHLDRFHPAVEVCDQAGIALTLSCLEFIKDRAQPSTKMTSTSSRPSPLPKRWPRRKHRHSSVELMKRANLVDILLVTPLNLPRWPPFRAKPISANTSGHITIHTTHRAPSATFECGRFSESFFCRLCTGEGESHQKLTLFVWHCFRHPAPC